ncbi:alpha/beta fold hydrolase [Flagellimonas myxillae]|uniref:alpha/beta fold hydrolase n=1 Tax=Flagellimonas myxillae TaxID=2942214 RepID=UPI00201F9BFB|nr:alpha/beta hydrolase [Muricauda myxillae]MCL6265034.1 alpha/beta fold hydrolase [Muricauda myxillae]
MKIFSLTWILAFSFISLNPLHSQTNPKPTYVIVHGAWGGSWAFKEVDSLLTATGNLVYRPSLTGQGERVHLASTHVGLDTHIMDVVNMILYEELQNVILVGHSYGGMVITGVADSIPERIAKMVYLDAMVPNDGENVVTLFAGDGMDYEIKDGHVVAPWVPEGKAPPKDVPHPYKTWTDNISLKNPERLKIPSFYILTVGKGMDPETDDFAFHASRAREMGWSMLQMEADHNPQWSAPKELVSFFKKIELR